MARTDQQVQVIRRGRRSKSAGLRFLGGNSRIAQENLDVVRQHETGRGSSGLGCFAMFYFVDDVLVAAPRHHDLPMSMSMSRVDPMHIATLTTQLNSTQLKLVWHLQGQKINQPAAEGIQKGVHRQNPGRKPSAQAGERSQRSWLPKGAWMAVRPSRCRTARTNIAIADLRG